MRHLKNLKLESKTLGVFEVERQLQEYLTSKDVKAEVAKFDNCFNIYISSYANEEKKKECSESSLLSFFKKLNVSEDAGIVKTQYGYKIVMGPDAYNERLMESYKNEEDNTYTCYICESINHGTGNDPWPISNNPTYRVCSKCNDEFVITERQEILLKAKNKIEEAEEQIDKRAIEHEASNEVLDSKFIWIFSVLNDQAETLQENISNLQDAIDSLVANNGTFLVAFPYVDPNPEEDSVDLVPADNPGPVVLYNKEEATLSKSKLQGPETATLQEESTIVEAEGFKGDSTKAKAALTYIFRYIRQRNSEIEAEYGEDGLTQILSLISKLGSVIDKVAFEEEREEQKSGRDLYSAMNKILPALKYAVENYYPEQHSDMLDGWDRVYIAITKKDHERLSLDYLITYMKFVLYLIKDASKQAKAGEQPSSVSWQDAYESTLNVVNSLSRQKMGKAESTNGKNKSTIIEAEDDLPYNSMTPRSYLRKNNKEDDLPYNSMTPRSYLRKNNEEEELPYNSMTPRSYLRNKESEEELPYNSMTPRSYLRNKEDTAYIEIKFSPKYFLDYTNKNPYSKKFRSYMKDQLDNMAYFGSGERVLGSYYRFEYTDNFRYKTREFPIAKAEKHLQRLRAALPKGSSISLVKSGKSSESSTRKSEEGTKNEGLPYNSMTPRSYLRNKEGGEEGLPYNSMTPRSYLRNTNEAERYLVEVTFTKKYYELYSEYEAEIELHEFNESYIETLENTLHVSYDTEIDFEYVGEDKADYRSNPCTWEEAQVVKENFEDDYLDIAIKEIGVE